MLNTLITIGDKMIRYTKSWLPKQTLGFSGTASCLLSIMVVFCLNHGEAQTVAQPKGKPVSVGVATIDITPSFPIMLAGYAVRNFQATEVAQRIYAKALAFGEKPGDLSVLIAVELVGIQGAMTERVAEILSEKTGISRSQFVICADHIHSGPEIGSLINLFGKQLSAEQIGHINLYLDELTDKLVSVAMQAIQDRRPGYLSRSEGQVNFAMNRRVLANGTWKGFGAYPEGPTDKSLPVLKVTDLNGHLRAVLLSYACHNTTLEGDFNQVHGDWSGEAQRIIQERHPGTTAMVILGCGADTDPYPRAKPEYTTQHGQEIADEVDRLLKQEFKPVSAAPWGKMEIVQLPFQHVPTAAELIEKNQTPGAEGYYALVTMDKMARGEKISNKLDYPIMVWKFGNDLDMVFLGGEVVVDYSLRLKKELGKDLWINAYSNDISCYIASERILREGGYEAERSMYGYNKPSRFSEGIEDRIVNAVHRLLKK